VTVESDLRGWDALHTRLALLMGGLDAPAPALGEGVAYGPLFYVAARSLPRMPATMTRARGGLRVLVLPESLCEGRSQLPSFQVTGCNGYMLRAGSGRRQARAGSAVAGERVR
jgi:hypothetical protein